MRRQLTRIVLALGIATAVALTPQPIASGQSAAADVASRIARIEQGLLLPVAITNTAPVKFTIADRMAHHKVPAVSVAFVENGKIAWARAYGVADVATKAPATPDTLFQAASISKPLTALAIMRLVQDGALALDEDVNLKLKSWKVPDNEFTAAQKVTLRRLLTHSAGLTVSGFPGYASTDAVPTVLQVLNGERPANTPPVRVDIEPGKISRYSGGGFTVMQLLLGDITGKPFPQLMREMVLAPAGMNASTYEQPLPAAMASRASGAYGRSGASIAGGPHTYPEMAAAGLWTTPSELARLALEMEAALEGKSSRILSPKTMKEMLTLQHDGYGLGIAVGGEGPALRFGHSGANAGYRCQWVHFPARHQGAILMTNSDAGSDLMPEILRAISAEYGWPEFKTVERTLGKVDASTFAAYAGTYQGERGEKAIVTLDNGRLFLQAAPLGPSPVELHPESATNFFVLTSALTVRFAEESIFVQQGPNSLTLKRVK